MKNEYKKLRIIITNRNTLSYLKQSILSIRNNESVKNDIIIYDDNSCEEDRKWIVDNSDKYGYDYKMINETCGKDYTRMGITLIRNLAMKESSYDVPVLWFHSDMIAGKDFDKNLLKHVGEGKIVSCTRIEPPVHPAQPKVKILKDFGNSPDEFKQKDFDCFVKDSIKEFKGKVSDGVFAPSCMFKEDYFKVGGINEDFIPQSKEDSQLDYKLKKAGFEFVQVWDSLVYHFGGRGSRNNGDGKDSEEWKASNLKNLKNFQRIWKEYPRYTETQNPNPPKLATKLALGILTKNCESDIVRIFNDYESFFDEIILVDDGSTDETIDLAKEFMVELKKNPLCATKQLKVVSNDLSSKDGTRNFALARNKGVEVCESPWIFWLDADEALEPELANMLNRITVGAIAEGKECIAFPRKNFIDGKQTEIFPDWQCRLHKKELKWVRPVHEMVEPFFEGLVNGNKKEAEKVYLFNDYCILHPKTSVRQKEQNKFYDDIQAGVDSVRQNASHKDVCEDKTLKGCNPLGKEKKPLNVASSNNKKLYCNSVLFSQEGITKHAREEMKQLQNLRWKIKINTDLIKNPEKDFFTMNEPIEIDKKDYITYINQPPIRESNIRLSLAGNLHMNNIVYFLAYEGSVMPPEWVQVMKDERIKKILTPSKYCKDLYEANGLKNVEVLHHGVDPEMFCPEGDKIDLPKQLADKFLYLFIGTYRGTKKDRKGLRILADAWKKFKKEKGNDDAHLILKLSGIYFNDDNTAWDNCIDDLGLAKEGITVIDQNLEEKKFAELLRSVKCLVAPSMSEGFGIIPLESLCCGTPVIATDTSGLKEYLTEDNALLIKTLRKTNAEEVFPYVGPTWHAQWDVPSTNHLVELLGKMKKDYKNQKAKAMKASRILRKDFSWEVVGKEMDKILESVK